MLNSGSSVKLPRGEHEGPFLVSLPVEIDGDGATIFIRKTNTAALNINVGGVRLFDVDVESGAPFEPALLVREDTVLERVNVFGSIVGKKSEEGIFDIPYTLHVGDVPPETPFEFTIRVFVPTAAEIVPENGVGVTVKALVPGLNTVGVRLPPARVGSIIKRSIFVKTAVTRKMTFTAAVSEKSTVKNYAPLLFEASSETLAGRQGNPGGSVVNSPETAPAGSGRVNASPAANSTVPVNTVPANTVPGNPAAANSPETAGYHPVSVGKKAVTPRKASSEPIRKVDRNSDKYGASGITELLPRKDNFGAMMLTRGMHYPVPGDGFFEIEMFSSRIDGVSADIDAFAFLHDGSGILHSSADLVYFGNDTAADGAVSYLNTAHKRVMYVDLQKLPQRLSQLDFVYSAYDGKNVAGVVVIKYRSPKRPESQMKIPMGVTDGSSVNIAFELTPAAPGFVLTPLLMPYRRDISELLENYGLKSE
jgi:stress response protein SCP2